MRASSRSTWSWWARASERGHRLGRTKDGQFTLPKAARDELGLRAGDEILMRVGRKQAVVAKTPDFLEWAGSVSVPAGKRGTAWDEVLRQTRRARVEKRR